MGHKSKLSLVRQVQERYDSLLSIGRSKYEDKKAGVTKNYIYSWSTYKAYIKHADYFTAWCKSNHGCKTLADCRSYAAAWMATRSTLSPYTQKLEASALAKLYGCSAAALGIETSSTSRSGITRSRSDAKRDKNFNEDRHSDFVEFCRSVGCRRKELQQLRGSDLVVHDGSWCIHFTRGTKGGRERYAPVCGNDELVVRVCVKAGTGKVIEQLERSGRVPEADIHSYRADYATRVYKQAARPIEELKGVREWYGKVHRTTGEKLLEPAIYRMRSDREGEVFDRAAMLKASRALGHNRISVVADHYLRKTEN